MEGGPRGEVLGEVGSEGDDTRRRRHRGEEEEARFSSVIFTNFLALLLLKASGNTNKINKNNR